MEKLIPVAGFCGPSNKTQTQRFDCQRTVNMFVELAPLIPGKEGQNSYLLPTPGLTLRNTLPGVGAIRAVYSCVAGTLMIAVRGDRVYSSTDNFITFTQIGTLTTTSGPVSISDSGVTLTTNHGVLVDGARGYSFDIDNPATTFVRITSPNFYPASFVTYQDGFFIFSVTNSQEFFTSDFNDITFSPLNKAQKAGFGDAVVSVLSNNRELLIFGKKTIEYWYNAGGAITVFQRIDGKFNNTGCISGASIKKLGDSVFWVGPNEQGGAVVFSMEGGAPKRVSNNTVELVLQSFSQEDLANISAWTYQTNGHFFYVIQIPGADSTWVYDMSTNLWAERTSTNANNNQQIKNLSNTGAYARGEFITGSGIDGRIFVMSDSVFTDDGAPILRKRVSPHISTQMSNSFITLFQIDCQPGVGLATGTNANISPKLSLRVSRDGGLTFGKYLTAPMGKIGVYQTRQRWARLGKGRDWVFEVTCTDAVYVSILTAWMSIEQGNA